MGRDTTPVDLDRVNRAVCGFPGIRRSTLTLKELKAFLLATPMPLLLNGVSWNVKSKRMCPGVYEVWLEENVHG